MSFCLHILWTENGKVLFGITLTRRNRCTNGNVALLMLKLERKVGFSTSVVHGNNTMPILVWQRYTCTLHQMPVIELWAVLNVKLRM